MKNILVGVLFCLSANLGFAQSKLVDGYFVDNDGALREVYIHYEQWGINPDHFSYQYELKGEVMEAVMEEVNEFGAPGFFEYKRFSVLYSKQPARINAQIERLFEEITLFLSVVVDGPLSIYEYKEGSLPQFFFAKGSHTPSQLIQHKHYMPDGRINTRKDFISQLYQVFDCSNTNPNTRLEQITYHRKSFQDIAVEYNTCVNKPFVVYETVKMPIRADATAKLHINLTNLKISGYAGENVHFDFGTIVGYGIGIETAFMLPARNYNFGLVFEPRLTRVKATTLPLYVNNDQLEGTFIDHSLELSTGFRTVLSHTANSSLFADACINLSLQLGSALSMRTYPDIPVDKKPGIEFGLGYRRTTFSAEVKVELDRPYFIDDPNIWSNDQLIFSMALGYSLK